MVRIKVLLHLGLTICIVIFGFILFRGLHIIHDRVVIPKIPIRKKDIQSPINNDEDQRWLADGVLVPLKHPRLGHVNKRHRVEGDRANTGGREPVISRTGHTIHRNAPMKAKNAFLPRPKGVPPPPPPSVAANPIPRQNIPAPPSMPPIKTPVAPKHNIPAPPPMPPIKTPVAPKQNIPAPPPMPPIKTPVAPKQKIPAPPPMPPIKTPVAPKQNIPAPPSLPRSKPPIAPKPSQIPKRKPKPKAPKRPSFLPQPPLPINPHIEKPPIAPKSNVDTSETRQRRALLSTRAPNLLGTRVPDRNPDAYIYEEPSTSRFEYIIAKVSSKLHSGTEVLRN